MTKISLAPDTPRIMTTAKLDHEGPYVEELQEINTVESLEAEAREPYTEEEVLICLVAI